MNLHLLVELFPYVHPCVHHVTETINSCTMKRYNPAWAKWLMEHHLSCHQG
jgi:hypothetical protein